MPASTLASSSVVALSTRPLGPAQVSIIRQVEVDIANEIDQFKAAHKEESSKLKLWSTKARECAAQIAECDGTHDSAHCCPVFGARNAGGPAGPCFPALVAGVEPVPLNEEAMAGVDAKDVNYRITILEEEMRAMDVDLEAIAKWRAADGEYGDRARELEAVTAERDAVSTWHRWQFGALGLAEERNTARAGRNVMAAGCGRPPDSAILAGAA